MATRREIISINKLTTAVINDSVAAFVALGPRYGGPDERFISRIDLAYKYNAPKILHHIKQEFVLDASGISDYLLYETFLTAAVLLDLSTAATIPAVVDFLDSVDEGMSVTTQRKIAHLMKVIYHRWGASAEFGDICFIVATMAGYELQITRCELGTPKGETSMTFVAMYGAIMPPLRNSRSNKLSAGENRFIAAFFHQYQPTRRESLSHCYFVHYQYHYLAQTLPNEPFGFIEPPHDSLCVVGFPRNRLFPNATITARESYLVVLLIDNEDDERDPLFVLIQPDSAVRVIHVPIGDDGEIMKCTSNREITISEGISGKVINLAIPRTGADFIAKKFPGTRII